MVKKVNCYFIPYGLNENIPIHLMQRKITKPKKRYYRLIVVILIVIGMLFGFLQLQKEEIDWEKVDVDSIPDYALSSAGAMIVSSNAKPYHSILYKTEFFNIPEWIIPEKSNPHAVLEPWRSPGECWSFAGQSASIIIKLSHLIVPKLITLEHIPAKISPNGHIKSAPRLFSVYAVDMDLKEHMGDFEYTGQIPNESFVLKPETKIEYPYRQVEIKFHTNHGHDFYTCVYKIRIHGLIYK